MINKQNSSNKIFIIVIALLLVANIATLFMLFGAKKNEWDDRKNAMRNYLKNEIGFTEAQLKNYDSLKTKQRNDAKAMFESMMDKKRTNLKTVGSNGFNDSVINIAATSSAENQKNIEVVMLNNLKIVRSICNPSQLQKFDTGFYKVMTRPPATENKK